MSEKADRKELRYDDLRDASHESKQFIEQWADDKLETLLLYSKVAPGFAEHLCTRVIEEFGQDTKLSALIQKHLSAERLGHKRGPRRKWTIPRLIVTLIAYYGGLEAGYTRKQVLLTLAQRNGLEGKNASSRLAKRIAEARGFIESGEVSKDLLPSHIFTLIDKYG